MKETCGETDQCGSPHGMGNENEYIGKQEPKTYRRQRSGGPKRRSAIARALLKQPKMLISDEATSSLHSSTAEHFAQMINQLKDKVTMLFIAYALARNLAVDEAIRIGVHESKMSAMTAQRIHDEQN